MDAAGDSERNDAASPSSPIPAGPHHAALNRQISGSKKSALTRTLDCDPDRNEFTIAMEYLHPEKFDSSTIPDSGTAGQTASQSRLRIEQEVAMIFESLSPDLDSHLRHAEPIEPTKQLDDSEPESHDMITATVSAPSIASSCHVEPSLDEYTAPSCDNFHMRWLCEEPEDPVPYIESAPLRKMTATDSSSGESALLEFFLQDLKCSCSNGTFVLCRACYMNDEWCHGDTHTLDQWVFPVDDQELNMPEEYIPEFFFCVEKSIRRFRSAHTLPTCTTYSLLSPEDSVLLDEERLQYKGSVMITVLDFTVLFSVSRYLFGPVRSAVQLTKNLQDLSITGFTDIQVGILELFQKTECDDIDALVFSPVNSGKSTAALLGLIMKASIKNDKSAIAYMSPEDFAEVQGRSCRAPFAIIVCPTRDLAIEIFKRAWYLCYNTNVKPVLSIGGNDDLTVGDILIGTTGKLNRIAKDRMTGPAQYVVIEQASDMLQDGSRRTLHRLLYENGAADCNTKFRCLFGDEDFTEHTRENYEKLVGSSAWHNPESPRFVTESFEPEVFPGEQVHQHFFNVENHYMDLVSRLTKALHRNDKVRAVVFTKTTEDCDILEDLLSRRLDDGFRKVRARGNNMSPRQREVNVEALRRGQCQVLITTGSLALGVKIINVTHVIHFTLPRDEKKDKSKLFVEYLQRNGMGGLSNHKITTWAYYDEEDEKLFTYLTRHLLEVQQATSEVEVLEKFYNGETIMPH
ncbi:ATP-dependent RNA helicase ded1 [Lasiodiplodia theobromae]|uniref:ATP-dependent RNA helicase ded1 n=1 Tax=Lasiodiplodia theobromae TaxID=45133 RepID=UPI0015C38C88|nr:ATP-dependent RNA helicase ded1 [Lasiodiplodia theobromae]KAF4534300.1 ATP-dependent RNA helicase ded1 [Lasiodiplodia theobromae]